MQGTAAAYPILQNNSSFQKRESEHNLHSRVRKEKRIPSLDLKNNLSQFHSPKPNVGMEKVSKGARSVRLKRDHIPEIITHTYHRVSQLNSPTLSTTSRIQREFPKYMIFFPEQDEVKCLEKSQTQRSTFYSFKALVDDTKKMNELVKDDLFSEFRSPDDLKRQLNFNKKQESLFQTTASSRLDQFRLALSSLRKESEQKVKKMAKVRIRPSPKYQPPEKKQDEETSSLNTEDDDLPKFKTLNVRHFSRFNREGKLNFYWKTISESKNFMKDPDVVEGASFVIMGKYAYLYGGRSQDLINDIARLDLTNWHWDYPSNVTDAPLYGRFGHTANVYNRKMIIFGGVKNYNTMLNIRECLNDVRVYDPHGQQWTYIKSSGEFIEPRRNHVALVVGKHLLVHGGISSTGQYLCDLSAFDLISHQWSSCHEINSDENGIAFHKACLVLDERRTDPHLFMMNDFLHDDDNRICSIKEEGIYFFGGRHHDGMVTNNLKILKIGKSSLKWIRPQTVGQSPDPRYLHTMSFCRSQNMLIIYGGRNDNLHSANKAHILGDFYTLHLDTFTWIAVTSYGLNGDPRYSHVSVLTGTKMIIFGGISFNHYCSSEINIVETGQSTFHRMVKTGRFLLPNATPIEATKNGPDNDDQEEISDHDIGIITFLPLPTPMMRPKPKSVDPVRKQQNYLSPRNELKNRAGIVTPRIKK